MPDVDSPTEDDTGKVDGRRARRERNRLAVVDAVLDLFGEEMLVPTIEKAAERSGLSLRSVYRYFPDPEALLQATIERQWELSRPLGHLEAIGEGPLDHRIEAFVAMRVRLFEFIGPVYRSTLHHEPQHASIREDLNRSRREFTEQFERQFAPELGARTAADRGRVVALADTLTQLESYDLLRRYRRLTQAEATEILEAGLRTLLSADS